MVAFDTLKASQRLRQAGFAEAQANALVSAFAEDIGANLATKDDIAFLRKDLDFLRKDFDILRNDVANDIGALRGDIETLRDDMARGNAALREDFTNEMAALRKDSANETAALRKDFANEQTLLRQDLKLRLALAFTGATALILAAIGAATGVLASL